MNENPMTAAPAANGVRPAPPGGFRPKFALYHANLRGTGGALKLALHPAHDDVDGSIFATLAAQKTVGSMTGTSPSFHTFDWEGAMTIKLDFNDLTQILQVLRGELESVNEEKGLFHRAPEYDTNIRFKHTLEPTNGYVLELYRSRHGAADSDRSGYFFFRPHEALGLSVAIENSLGVICFGIPKVIPRDTTAYRNAVKGGRDAAAA